MKVNGIELDHDTVQMLKLLQKRDETLATHEIRDLLTLKDNDYTRRRMEKLEDAGFVEMGTEPYRGHLKTSNTTITDKGRDFLRSWDMDKGIGDGLPTEEKIRRLSVQIDELNDYVAELADSLPNDKVAELEERVDNIAVGNNQLREDMRKMEDRLFAVEQYLKDEVNADLDKHRAD